MKNRKINTFLVSICLLGILAVATNTLLIVHLSSCGHEHEDNPSSSRPTHDHNHCPLCQVFLGVSGKYLAESPTSSVFIETLLFQNTPFISNRLSQNTFSSTAPRSPPCC